MRSVGKNETNVVMNDHINTHYVEHRLKYKGQTRNSNNAYKYEGKFQLNVMDQMGRQAAKN